MNRSVLLQKVFLVVIVALVLAALCTGAIYTAISRTLFASIKSAELLPKARVLSQLLAQKDGSEKTGSMLNFMKSNEELLGGYFVITDADGNMVISNDDIDESVFSSMGNIVARVLKGEEVSAYSAQTVANVQIVGVGVPITRDGAICGTVLIFVPLYETMAAVRGLNSALLISILIIMPITVMLVYLIIGRIIKPLRQMRDVALAMADGDFSIRADADQSGEIGQMAASLNYLSRELSHTISELTIERNRLKQSVDSLREGFVSINSEGDVTYTNPALLELFPQGDPNAGRRMALIGDETIWKAFDTAVARKQTGVKDITLGGRVIRATISPVSNEKGCTVGAVGLFSDITESERLERTRRDFVANVSHELRTPLTALRGLIEPLRDGMVRSEEARMRYYNIILRETLRLSRLIDDLMELSRLQSGRLSLECRKVDMSIIAEDLAEKYTYTAADKEQTFTLTTPPEQWPCVMANADRVEQILVILLDNAMKYTPEGGRITLSVETEGGKAVLRVSDTGVGIAEEDLPYVFDRFYKADKSHTGSGSGLGLSIAREILQQMGENITVTSEKGKGSTFSFTLPLAGAAAVPAVKNAPNERQSD